MGDPFMSVRLQEVAANRLSHAEFLELVLQDELNVRQQRQMERRAQAADFHTLKQLEDFDWSFNPSVHKKEIYDLAACKFIREAKDVLFLGPPGVGKTPSRKPSVTRPSARISWCSTVPSSIWSETS